MDGMHGHNLSILGTLLTGIICILFSIEFNGTAGGARLWLQTGTTQMLTT